MSTKTDQAQTRRERVETLKTEERPTVPRADLAVEVDPTGVGASLAATSTKQCRVWARQDIFTEEITEKERNTSGTVFAALGLGFAAMIPLALVARNSAEGGTPNAGLIVAALSPLLIFPIASVLIFPSTKTSTEIISKRPYEGWVQDAYACKGATPEPLTAVPTELDWQYQRLQRPLASAPEVTNRSGRAQFDINAFALLTGHCGPAGVSASLADERLRANYDVRSPSVPFSSSQSLAIEHIRSLDPKLGDAAFECCAGQVAAEQAEACENTCGQAGAAEKCTNGRRVCKMRASRAPDASKLQAECETLFNECLIGQGTKRDNFDNCMRLCIGTKAQSICR